MVKTNLVLREQVCQKIGSDSDVQKIDTKTINFKLHVYQAICLHVISIRIYYTILFLIKTSSNILFHYIL